MPKWFIYSLLTILAWGAWGALGRALPEMSAGQSQAFSTLGILPVMLGAALSPGFRAGGRKRLGSVQAILAGLLVGMGNAAYYQAVSLSGAATTVSFTGLYPVVAVLLALIVLRERPRPWQIAGIIGSLAAIGLLTVSLPEGGLREWFGYAVASVLLWGVASVLMKVATGHVSAELATFWFLAAFIPLAAAILAFEPAMFFDKPLRWTLPGKEWMFVTLLGATYGLGNLTLLAAYRNEGQAAVVTPLSGLYPIVTIPLAIAYFKESIGPWQWAGVGLALLSGIALSYEPKRPEEVKRPPSA